MKTFFKVKNLLKSMRYLKRFLSLNATVKRECAVVCNTFAVAFSDRHCFITKNDKSQYNQHFKTKHFSYSKR